MAAHTALGALLVGGALLGILLGDADEARASTLLGLVLGPQLEENFRRANPITNNAQPITYSSVSPDFLPFPFLVADAALAFSQT